jgi:hypothetical protein
VHRLDLGGYPLRLIEREEQSPTRYLDKPGVGERVT